MTDRETSIVDDGHLYRKIGGRWTHDSSTCCPATEWTRDCAYLRNVKGKIILPVTEEGCFLCGKMQPRLIETPTTWTHKCSYLSHSDGKVTLTDRSLNCFFCGARAPGDAVKVEPWWKYEPIDEMGVWVHLHGRQEIFAPHWTLECRPCGAKRPPTDQKIKSLTEWWAWMVHQIGDQNP